MKIETRKSPIHGKGIFATQEIKEGETIEVCPIILLEKNDTTKIDETALYNYYFAWENGASAIALGCGSLYNHSYTPNAMYKKDFSKHTISFTALATIPQGEEIFTNYNGDPESQEKVWFET